MAQEVRPRARDLGLEIGVFKPGNYNAITDVKGVTVGHHSLLIGDSVRTGVTAILPHQGNLYQEKVPGAIYIGNGYGKLTGISQVEELGTIESPVILTNTLSVSAGVEGAVRYTLEQPGNETVRSVNAVVGETNDGYLNDIRKLFVTPHHVRRAIDSAKTGLVSEGTIGAGVGTVCFGFKGGIGTASRVLPPSLGGYTVGVLVQSNFGGVLKVDGVPVGKEWAIYPFREAIENADGSCMIVVATDAPMDARNLKRLAKRAFLGLAQTGGFASNGSGDYVIAFSTSADNRVMHATTSPESNRIVLDNAKASPLFQAAVECTEEAILNSLLRATTVKGYRGEIQAISIEKLKKVLQRFGRLP
ncbi:MAG: P1 family peptidase [Saprospiraceae bacterium]|nr:P1 family peptidase [Saprospiraceae bacterium]